MALHHADPGDIIDVRPLGEELVASKTKVLAKTDYLEILRLVVPAGKEIPSHKVTGPISVQCLEGHIELFSSEARHTMKQGHLLYLASNEPHSVKAIENSSVLVIIHKLPK
jgi:quercetin dioxygenase-like cupin family protein